MGSIQVLFIVCQIFTFVWLVSASANNSTAFQSCLKLMKADYSGERTICPAQGDTLALKGKDCEKKNCCWSFIPSSRTKMECYQQPSDKPVEVKCEPTGPTSSAYPKNCLDLAKVTNVVQRTPCTVEGDTPVLKRKDCIRKKGCWSPVPNSKNEFQCYQQPSDKPASSPASPEPKTSSPPEGKTLKGSPKNAKICDQLAADPGGRTTCKVAVTLVNEETCLQSKCCWQEARLIPGGFGCYNPPKV